LIPSAAVPTQSNIDSAHETPLRLDYVFVIKEGKVLFGKRKNAHGEGSWEWHDWKNPPEPLFIPLQNLKKQNFQPF